MVRLLKLVKQNILYWGIAFLLFFIPIYPKFPLLAVPGTYVAIRLEDLLVSLLIGFFILRLWLAKDKSIFDWPLTKLVFLFFGVGLLANLSGILITKNIVPHLAFLHWLRRIEYMSLLFVAYYSFSKIKELKAFALAIGAAVSGVIIYGLGQKFFGWPVVSTMNKEFSKGMVLRLTWWARVNSTFAGHYDLAAYLVMILALGIAVFILVKSWRWRVVIALLGLFSYYLLLLTASRISFGAYLMAVVMVLIFSQKKLWIVPFLIFSILGIVFSEDLGQRYAATFKIDLSFLSARIKFKPSQIALLPTLMPTPTEEIGAVEFTPRPLRPGEPTPTLTPTPTPKIATPSAEPIESTALAVGRSTDIRLKVEWPRAIRAFLKNPLLGTGYSSITLATDNDYLRLLGEVGILGFLAFLAIILEIGRKLICFLAQKQTPKVERILVLGIVGAAIGFFVNASFIDVFEASKIAFFFWIMMGVGLRVIDLEESSSVDQKIGKREQSLRDQ